MEPPTNVATYLVTDLDCVGSFAGYGGRFDPTLSRGCGGPVGSGLVGGFPTSLPMATNVSLAFVFFVSVTPCSFLCSLRLTSFPRFTVLAF